MTSKTIFRMTVENCDDGGIREHHDIEITKVNETVAVLNLLINRVQDLLQALNGAANVKVPDFGTARENLR